MYILDLQFFFKVHMVDAKTGRKKKKKKKKKKR